MATASSKQPPKIDLVVGIIGLLVCIGMDAISIIPPVSDVEEFPAALILIIQTVLGMGGVVTTVQMFAMALKAIPVIQEFPFWTLAWITMWVVTNLPAKIAKPIMQAAEKAAEAESGGVGAVAQSAEETAANGLSEGMQDTQRKSQTDLGENGIAHEDTDSAQESGDRTEEPREAEASEPGSPRDENYGDSMGEVQENLLEPEKEENPPEAPLPYEKDQPMRDDARESSNPTSSAKSEPSHNLPMDDDRDTYQKAA